MLPDTQAREGAAASLSPHPATTFSDEVNVFVAKHQRVLLLGALHRLEHEAHSRLWNVRRKAALVEEAREGKLLLATIAERVDGLPHGLLSVL